MTFYGIGDSRIVQVMQQRTSPGDFVDPHPYVIGKEPYQRYLNVQAECVQASAARSGQVLTQ